MNDPTDPRRRQLLMTIGAMGVGVLPGSSLGGDTVAAEARAQANVDALALPPVTLPRNSIDVHAHFFNASDASVIGYFTHSMLHASPRLQRFAVRMQGVLEALISIAPSARQELDSLQDLYTQKMAPELMDAALDMREFSRRRRIAREIARVMRESGMSKEFGTGFSTDKGFEAVPRDEEEIRALLDPDGMNENKAMALSGFNVAGMFRFMGCMLQERWMTLRAYRRGHGRRGISAVFGALVDFDYFYNDPARSPLADQVKLHSLLVRQSEGFMLPLMAYNPWADIKTRGARLELLTDAVKHHGFIGAKIYPPVGFLPYGNTKAPDGLDPGDLNRTLKAFFVRCSDLGIPVMAHANSTQGRDDDADYNSAPAGWRALIDEMAKDSKVPVLNLGHFGGHGGEGESGVSNDWPVRFAELMRSQGGQGIYGDLGNWSALRDCRRRGSDCAPLSRLADARKMYPELNSRLMYGSDYFMMIKDVDWKRWPEDIAAAMNGTGFDASKLFHENAMRCFGLLPGGANRARLEMFFSGKLPAWMA